MPARTTTNTPDNTRQTPENPPQDAEVLKVVRGELNARYGRRRALGDRMPPGASAHWTWTRWRPRPSSGGTRPDKGAYLVVVAFFATVTLPSRFGCMTAQPRRKITRRAIESLWNST